MKKGILYLTLLTTSLLWSQQQISLNDCYNLVNKNYPIAKKTSFLEKKNTLELEVIDKEKLPQLDFNAQATYQSEVINIPIPNSGIEPPNNDQYRATLSVNQLIYAGGAIDANYKLKQAILNTQQKQVEVNLYQLKKQVNQIYFSILLVQEKSGLLDSKKEMLLAKLKELKSGIRNGMILPTSDKIIEAELLKIEQQYFEINQTKKSLVSTLSLLISEDISEITTFQNPEISVQLNTTVNRPELELFQLKKDEIDSSEELVSRANHPKLFGFATGGYGNPGLDPLDNSFQAFYTVGIKLNWSVFDWNSTKKQMQAISINKDIIDIEEEIFSLNTQIELNQLENDIQKYSDFIETDSKIISLRKEVLKSAESQLKNGVITSSAYITELTNLYEDENNKSKHNTQLQLIKANYNITKGI